MQCSAPVPVSRGLAIPSPSSLAIASANGNVLEIRDIDTLSLLHSITTSGTHISHIVWSPSSDILAAASVPSNSVVLVNPATGAVLADVHDSPLPIAALSLSATGVLLVSAVHAIAINLFSIHRSKLLATVPFVNHRSPSSPMFAWSPCAKFIAIATRKNSVHGLVIVSLSSGNVEKILRAPEQLAGINEVAGLRWLPSGNLLVWGGPLDLLNYSAAALMAPSGKVLSSLSLLKADHELSATDFECSEESRRLSPSNKVTNLGLGIKTLTVNPSGTLLAIGGYDGFLRIISVARWKVIKTFRHDSPEISATSPPVIFRERTKDEDDSDDARENKPANGNLQERSKSRTQKRKRKLKRSYFQVVKADGGVEITKRVRSASAPGTNTFGVSSVEFSPDGKFVSSKADKAGNVVYIWDVANLRLSAVLILEQDVKVFRWSKRILNAGDEDRSPSDNAQLAVSCGEGFIYIWRRSGAAAVSVHEGFDWRTPFKARKIAWSHDNSALAVTDGISANAFMSVYIPG